MVALPSTVRQSSCPHPEVDRMSLTIESIETIPIRVPLPFTYKGS
jgi:hypothetical protein